MKLPKTTFLSTKETEAQRLLQIAIYIVNRFWQKKSFLLLPYDTDTKSTGREVYFPDLNYPKSFWDEAKRLAKTSGYISIPLETDPKIIKEIIKILPESPPETGQIISKWKATEQKFWQFCRQTFPEFFKNVKNVEIWATRYDRLSSFTVGQNNIRVWIYFQSPTGDIAEAILSAILRDEHFKNGYTWEESEAFVDNLILSTSLNKLFPNWKPTLVGLRTKESARYAADSKVYFEKLGYPSEPVFALFEGQIIVENKPLVNHMTATEGEILRELITNEGRVLSFEQIGDILWGEEAVNKYSEYAITKAMQRLREKITSLGITSEVIQTKRGQGYLLVN